MGIYRVILTNDYVTIRIVNLTTMLFTKKHKLSRSSTFDEYKIDVQHAEDDEHKHHEDSE